MSPPIEGTALTAMIGRECPDDLRDAILRENGVQREAIEWHSRTDFQIVSLTLIAEAMIRAHRTGVLIPNPTPPHPILPYPVPLRFIRISCNTPPLSHPTKPHPSRI